MVKSKVRPDTKFTLEGEIASTGIQLRALYSGGVLEFGDNMVMESAALTLRAGLNTEIALSGDVVIKDPPLKFRGTIIMTYSYP